MTEPTHNIRSDVAVQLDMILAAVMRRVGMDDIDEARERLRHDLARAWHAGWMAGYRECTDNSLPSSNPYHETDI